MPEITIIVPVYNMEKYIHRCVDSILAQTFADFELILVDDGSVDGSGLICDAYALRDKRVKVIRQENGGQSKARNAGIDVAVGAYLGFVDSDDWIDQDMYESLLEAMKQHDADISTCSKYRAKDSMMINNDPSGSSFPSYNVSPGLCIWSNKEAIELMLSKTYIDHSVCTKLFKKQIFQRIRFPEGKYYEDMFVIAELLYTAEKIVSIGQAKYYYYHRPDSTTMDVFTPKQLDYYYSSQAIADFVSEKFPDLRKKARSVYHQGLVRILIRMQPEDIKSRYPDEYRVLFDAFVSNYRHILKDNAFTLYHKMVLTAVVLKIYTPMKKLIMHARRKNEKNL